MMYWRTKYNYGGRSREGIHHTPYSQNLFLKFNDLMVKNINTGVNLVKIVHFL